MNSTLARIVSPALVALCLPLTSPDATALQGTLTQSRYRTLTEEEDQILSYMSLEMVDDGTGTLVPTIRITGANLQIVNGLGATNGNPGMPDALDALSTATDSSGNLIVGYNETGNPAGDDRTGSHNVVVGHGNSFSSFGAIVGARDNTASGAFGSVLGGTGNQSTGNFAAVTGGAFNEATGDYSSVSGGRMNVSSGPYASISGGFDGAASGEHSSISGGYHNISSSF